MPSFEQMNIEFSPAEQPRTQEGSENETEKRTAEALRAIGRIFPHEDLDELHSVTPEGIAENSQVMIIRRPPDSDKYKEETFFEVHFNDKGQAAEVHEIRPQRLSFDDVLKRKRGI